MNESNFSPDQNWEYQLTLLKALQEKMESLEMLVTKLVAHANQSPSDLILDDLDVRKLLKICRRTSLEYRQKGILRFHKKEAKIFYLLDEILEDIKNLPGNV